MPPFLSTSKALRSFSSRKTGVRQLISFGASHWQLEKPDRCQCFSTIAGIQNRSICKPFGCYAHSISAVGGFHQNYFVQMRQFLGCGDGEEGVLSKVYEEKRVLGYSPEQLFNVVAAVDFYHGFVPWCQRSEIIKDYPDGSFDAELEIGFKYLVESYVSHVELERPKRIKTTVSQSTLFEHLINIWEFNPGPVPGSCNVYFLVDFKFQSPLYRQFKEAIYGQPVEKNFRFVFSFLSVLVMWSLSLFFCALYSCSWML
ncbi:uncharacterized protein LOC129317652 isoform X2 [Prosopis cineraria]|uniref:uncharacterized protein LOC129317652 isoform X2 n=1 Tax=Prosopis cineraria TaxID=364024 RepID=UPI00240F0DC0|nr:uncharacterized protein LOC129317652 isoform X2 [Prosopis cineraria]